MLANIIAFSVKQKLIVGLLLFGFIIYGCYQVTKLPIDAVPDITNNQVQVITQSPSLAAEEIERLITFPVEQTMSTIPGISEVRSISRFGLSVVTIVFHDDVEIYWARQQVSERLNVAVQLIPQGSGTPGLSPVSTGLGEIYQYVLHPTPGYEEKYSPMELRTIQDWIVRRQLLGTEGVADVSSFGGYLKQYEISLNTDQLKSYNVSIQQVFKALEASNQNTGGAYIDKGPKALFIRSEGLIGSLVDIEKIQVANTVNGLPVLIRDVATVNFGHAHRYGAMTRNGKGEVVGGLVLMLKGENSNKVITNVKTRIAQIEKTLPEGLVVEPFLDRSHLVNRAISTVSKNLIEGALIVIFVLVLFLGNFRGGLIVASMIPLCMLFAVSMMNLFGVSGNLMSLGAIDFGLIVDGAVIIVEATLHHLGLSKKQNLTQAEMDEEVLVSATNIRKSAAFGEIIILIVYLPILALAGVEGKMFKPMAETVVFAILGAFILSLTYVPMMSALFLSKHISTKRNFSDKLMDFFHRAYQPLIHFALKYKKATILSSVILFVGSMLLFSTMGGEFIPSLEEGDFAVETRVLTGSSLSKTIEASTKAEQILLQQFPEVKQVVSKIGSSEIPTDPMPIEACDLMIILKDKHEWTSATTRDELVAKMSKALEVIPGVSFGFQQPIQMRFNELMTGARQDVAIKIFGEDLETLTTLSRKIATVVKEVDGAADLYVEEVTGLPQIVAKIDRDKLYQFNVSIQDVNQAIRASFAGEVAGVVYEGEKRFDLVVRLEKDSRQNIDDVQNLYVVNGKGQQIPLSQLAEISLVPGPNQIQREDAKRRLTVGFNVRGRDVESIVSELEQKIAGQVNFPPGYYVTYGGQFENLMDAKNRLAIAVPIAMALILGLLFFTFHSLRQAVLIFTAVPLSAIGGILALYARGMPFSISAGIGFIALFGVSVLNGIVLIGEFNRLKKEGLTDMNEIILTGTRIRLRPVMMTALVASFGFLPMALSNGSGAEVQKPLATVVIGGLFTATLLTLMVLPVMYSWFEKGLKMNKQVTTLLIVLGLFSTTQTVNAQTDSLSLKYCIEKAVANNNGMKSADYFIQMNGALRKSSTDFGKTNVTAMYGQYNTYRNDLNITATQNFAFPTVYVRLSELAKANVESSRLQKDVLENELIYNVKQTWYQLLFLGEQQKLLKQQDSIYVNFVKASEIRYKTGESNYLQKVTAETQLYEIKNRMSQNEADIEIHLNTLSTLMNTEQKLRFDEDKFSLTKQPLLFSNDSAAYKTNPALEYMQQQIVLQEKQKQVERSKYMPDINLGYFNQSLIGYQENTQGVQRFYGSADRFQGVMVGLSVPLWFRSNASKVKAAEFGIMKAEADFTHMQRNYQGQYNQLIQEYLKFDKSVLYFEQNVLPQATLLLNNAQKSYQLGEIGYMEYSASLNKALGIRTEYISLVAQHNQAISNIEFIIGNK